MMLPGLPGVSHLHSTYSDGEFSLGQLRQVLQAEGFRFGVLGDHAEALSNARLREYRAEAADLSDGEFSFVPGVEFTCEDGMHVHCIGVAFSSEERRPERLFAAIREQGGIAVVAHPREAHFTWIEGWDLLPDGVEVWNTKYDGPRAPRPRTFELLARLRTRAPTLCGHYGLDLHWRTQPRPVSLRVDCVGGDIPAVVVALRDGRFIGWDGEHALPSNGDVDQELLASWQAVSSGFLKRRARMRRLNVLLGGLGSALPSGVKGFLRRFL
jgi:hypothetical protein